MGGFVVGLNRESKGYDFWKRMNSSNEEDGGQIGQGNKFLEGVKDLLILEMCTVRRTI